MNNDDDYLEVEIESEIEPEDDAASYDDNDLLDADSIDSLENSEDDVDGDIDGDIDGDVDGDADVDGEDSDNSDIDSNLGEEIESDDEIASNSSSRTIVAEKLGVINLYNKLSKKGLKSRHITATNPPLVKKNIILEKSNKPKVIYIVPELERITSDLLLKSERAQLQAIFSKQIDRFGCPEYLNDIVSELKENKINVSANDIAEAAVLQRRCPLKLRRIIGENNKDELVVEEWDPNTMKIHATT